MTKLSIRTVKSESRPGVAYKVTLYSNGSWWCSCPSFKFQRGKTAQERQCKHTRALTLKLFKKSKKAHAA